MTDTNYSESPAALEREVDAERSRVAETLDALQDKMSVGSIVDDVVRGFSRYGGDMANNLGRQARQNPLPLLLTGVGLVWLIAGSGRARHLRDEDYLWDLDDDVDDEDFADTRRYGVASRVQGYGEAEIGGTYAEGGRHRDRGEDTGASIRGAAGSAAARLGGAAESVGQAAGSAASGLGEAAGSASSRVRRAARGAYSGARHASKSVRERAHRAYDAGRHSARRIDDAVHEHPLAMGALALAVGAAIGGALPRTRTEDEYLGDYSDGARETARDTVRREAEKARRVAGAVAEEARDIYAETAEEVDRRLRDAASDARSAAERAGSEAAGAAERLRDAAMSEADRQHLGDPKSPA